MVSVTKNVVVSAADRVHDIGKAVITPVIQVAKLIPGVSMLTSSVEQRVENERDTLVERAGRDDPARIVDPDQPRKRLIRTSLISCRASPEIFVDQAAASRRTELAHERFRVDARSRCEPSICSLWRRPTSKSG